MWDALAAADRLPDDAEELLHIGTDPTQGQVDQGTTLTTLPVTEICHKLVAEAWRFV